MFPYNIKGYVRLYFDIMVNIHTPQVPGGDIYFDLRCYSIMYHDQPSHTRSRSGIME